MPNPTVLRSEWSFNSLGVKKSLKFSFGSSDWRQDCVELPSPELDILRNRPFNLGHLCPAIPTGLQMSSDKLMFLRSQLTVGGQEQLTFARMEHLSITHSRPRAAL